MPTSRDMAIFVLTTTTTQPITLPLAHARGVTSANPQQDPLKAWIVYSLSIMQQSWMQAGSAITIKKIVRCTHTQSIFAHTWPMWRHGALQWSTCAKVNGRRDKNSSSSAKLRITVTTSISAVLWELSLNIHVHCILTSLSFLLVESLWWIVEAHNYWT